MKILMACLGTLGDFLPYLVLGRALAARRHDVTILSDATKRDATLDAGLNFEEVMCREDWETFVSHPSLWNADTCVPVVFKSLLAPSILPVYRVVARVHQPGNTLLIGGAGALGFKLARESFRVPLMHLHLSPYQAISQAPANAHTDDSVRDFINGIRRGVGLRHIGVPFFEWYNSADLAIAAYPQWFHGPPRAGEPENFAFTSFLFDDADAAGEQGQWLRFVAGGSAPVVFTAGTGMRHGREFFDAALSLCGQLSLRAIFLTTHLSQLPPLLPPHVHASTYICLDRLLPHAAGIVHHGGIGTLAQALKAGVPQLVMPMALDQFDNAAQLARLGAARVISRQRISTREFTDSVAAIQRSPELRAECRGLSERLRGASAASEIIGLIERRWPARRPPMPLSTNNSIA